MAQEIQHISTLNDFPLAKNKVKEYLKRLMPDSQIKVLAKQIGVAFRGQLYKDLCKNANQRSLNELSDFLKEGKREYSVFLSKVIESNQETLSPKQFKKFFSQTFKLALLNENNYNITRPIYQRVISRGTTKLAKILILVN